MPNIGRTPPVRERWTTSETRATSESTGTESGESHPRASIASDFSEASVVGQHNLTGAVIEDSSSPGSQDSSGSTETVTCEPISTLAGKMADSRRKHLEAVSKAVLQYDDYFEGIDIADLEDEVRVDLLKEARKHADNLADAISFLNLEPVFDGRDEQIDLARDVKRKFVIQLRTGWTNHTNRRETSRPNSSASNVSTRSVSDDIKIERVKAALNFASTTSVELQDELAAIMKASVRTNQDLRRFETNFKDSCKKINRHINHLKEQANIAVDVGERELVLAFDNMVAELQKLMRKAEQQMNVNKENLGIPRGEDISSHTRPVNIKAAHFNGESGLDFYSFKAQFEMYVESIGLMTNSDRAMKLKFECLHGVARDDVDNIHSYEEIMRRLEYSFGRPQVMLASKMSEIEKLGTCPSDLIKRRSWVISLGAKLNSLNDLVNKHHMQAELQASNLVHLIQKGMRRDDFETFKKDLKQEADVIIGGGISRKLLLEKLFRYVADLADDATLDVDIYMASKVTVDDKPKVVEKSKPINKPRAFLQNHDEHGQLNEEHIPEGENDFNFACNSVEPQFITCKVCNKRHTHLFYCSKYQKCPVKKRWLLICKSGACFRCLRLDASFSPKPEHREPWFEKHKGLCNDDWVCKQDGCESKGEVWKNHFTLCKKHIEENKKIEGDFVKGLEKGFSSSKVGFFLATHPLPLIDDPMSRQHPGELHGHESEDGSEEDDGQDCDDAELSNNVHQQPAPVSSVYKLTSQGENCIVLPDVEDPPVYMLHYLYTECGKALLTFYDSGCYGASISDAAYSVLKTECVRPGPTRLEVAGGKTYTVPHGDERFWWPVELGDGIGRVATLTALRMTTVSAHFPLWPLQQAWVELNNAYNMTHSNHPPLPLVEEHVGGTDVDVMIGIRYNRYFPKLLFSLPSGLSIYRSVLNTRSTKMGVLGGPHPIWKQALAHSHLLGPRMYLTNEMKAYYAQSAALHSHLSFPGPISSCEVDDGNLMQDELINQTEACCHEHCVGYDDVCEATNVLTTRSIEREAAQMDDIGSSVDYRCVRCRNCAKCKQSELLERTSLAEEAEQVLIENCVTVHLDKKIITSKLPFICDPDEKLKQNQLIAEKILNTQMNLIRKSPETRDDILKSHQKLLDNGHVVPLDQLPDDQQKVILAGGYTIPWRTVASAHSLSTPVRLVYDASSRTPGGDSLNDVLAKGQNKIAKMFNLLVIFRAGKAAFSADVSMAYNGVKLEENHYKYQKYLWIPGLEEGVSPQVMLVKTLIYGVRPSGNLTQAAFMKLGEAAIQKFPHLEPGARALMDSSYVDDVFPSYNTKELCQEAAVTLQATLELGSMQVKAITYSGQKPSDKVSKDGVTVGLVGYKWKPEDDVIMLDIKPLFLGKVKRGRLPELVTGNIGDALKKMFTRRVLSGKCAGVYDPMGLATPVTGRLKLDMSSICKLKVGWDEILPMELLDKWVQNLEDIQDLGKVTFPRAVLDMEAADDNLDLIICSDASEQIGAAAVYARFRMKTGGYKCSLLVAKCRLVGNCTIPRAELRAAVIGATLGHVVKAALKEKVENIWYVTDSAIALFWINTDDRPLQTGVRNMVIEIRRLSDATHWFHIDSDGNPADIATRYAQAKDIGPGSEWQCGKPWMYLEREDMPLRTVADLTLSCEDKKEAYREIRNADIQGIVLFNLVDKVASRYSLGNYLLDPCATTWPKFVHLLALVVKCKQIWLKREAGFPKSADHKLLVQVGVEEEKVALNLIFQCTTLETKKFNSKERLEKLGVEKDGILFYTGRVLDEHRLDAVAKNLIDVTPLTFVKPIVDRFSPVAYSIMTHAHVKMTHHGGAVSTLRASRNIAFILQGRDLAAEVRSNCPYCKRYTARMVEAEMGKLNENRLKIAPAFYQSQVDLFGPFLATCEHNFRSKVKIWGVVFKCPATLAIAVYCMPGYSTECFIQAYTRFSARYGHPAKLFIDAGGQLMKACNDMEISVADLTRNVNTQYGTQVDFETCPVGGHNAHGIVERSIREVRKIFQAVFGGLKIDIMGYETAFAYISNELNSLPLCLGSRCENLEDTDLITPSRLILGRNNTRSVAGLTTMEDPGRLLKQMEEVEKSWWAAWRDQKILDFLYPPGKWDKSDKNVRVGDIVIFVQTEGSAQLGKVPWKIGRVKEVVQSSDGIVRTVILEYKNASENVFRETKRTVRRIAVIQSEEDSDIPAILSEASKQANVLFFLCKKI